MQQAPPFQRLWQWLSAPPDEALADAAREGEAMVARIRTWVTLLLLVSPVLSLIVDPEIAPSLVGLGVALAALLVAITIERILQRGFYRPSLSFISSITDVSLVSLALLVFWIIGRPIVTSNSRVLFECYFLAIAAAALRYDHRVVVVAGFVAMTEWLGLSYLVWATGHGTPALRYNELYGEFQLSSQLSRALVLLAMTIVSLAVVHRAERLRLMSTGDRLTGLFNRAYVEEYLANEVLRTARAKGSLALGMLDVDRFKVYNDSYGHAAGDAALRQVASLLKALLRRSDVVARYGGEEILLILPATSLAAAMEKFEEVRVRIGLTPLHLPKGGQAHLTVSIGVAAFGVDGSTVSQLLDVADARLYEAKDAGRNRVIGPPSASALPHQS